MNKSSIKDLQQAGATLRLGRTRTIVATQPTRLAGCCWIAKKKTFLYKDVYSKGIYFTTGT